MTPHERGHLEPAANGARLEQPNGYGDARDYAEYRSNGVNGDVDAQQDQQVPDGEEQDGGPDDDDEETTAAMSRHGFQATEEALLDLQSRYYLYFTDVSILLRSNRSKLKLQLIHVPACRPARTANNPFDQTRHANAGHAKAAPYTIPADWRSKDKIKIGHGALVVCLRIGFDPPDVIKTTPCARLEAWVDTTSVGKDRAMEQIATNLQKQFEGLAMSSKAKFSTYMDPAHEDLRKLCVGLRRKARGDRALFHYNGHGVPRPTSSGEIWVFNRQYTQYIPVSVADIVGYLGGPCVYIWDCSNAGHIVNKILELQNLPEGKFPPPSATTAPQANTNSQSGHASAAEGTSTPPVAISHIQDIIQLAACQPHETLPMNPDLPADLFTSCITSPIEMSIRFFILHNPLRTELKHDLSMKIPGKLSDRKTPLGELIWIFTSVTDTIAWNTMPRHLFQRLFRHDLVMAAIFRGFLLAERIMKRYNCTPVSVPEIPACANHPLWDSWDLALDRCLSQMPALIAYEQAKEKAEANNEPPPPPVIYSHSYFFADHLSAFAVWIDQGTARTVESSRMYAARGYYSIPHGFKRTLPGTFGKTLAAPKLLTNGSAMNGTPRSSSTATAGAATNGTVARSQKTSAIPVVVGDLKRHHKTLRSLAEQPEHLPILLQVLLSQVHRLRALMLLCKFLDLGPWAVNLGLAIGIFPYVLKLLQAPGPELRPVLVYIWARILAVYRLCQEDLAKPAGLPSARNGGRPELPIHYFASVFDPHQQMLVIPNVSEHRAMCAFILSIFMRDYPYGQQLALTVLPPNSRSNVFESCLFHLNDEDPLLRQWSALCIGILWDDFDEAKGLGVRLKAHSELTTQMHQDMTPDVRASILFALGVFVGASAGDIQSGKGNAGRGLSGSAVERTGLTEQWQADEELGVAMATLKMQGDGSPIVRRELVVLLSAIVYNHRGHFVVAAYDHAMQQKSGERRNPVELFEERMTVMEQSLRYMDPNRSQASTYSPEFKAIMFSCMYRCLLDLAADPFPDVAERAQVVVDYIHELLVDSDLPFATPAPEDEVVQEDGSDQDGEDSGPDSGRSSNSTANTDPPPTGDTSLPNTGQTTPSLSTAIKAVAKLGLGEAAIARSSGPPSAASAPQANLGSGRTAASAGLSTSKSVANLGDYSQANRTVRHVTSADSLLQQQNRHVTSLSDIQPSSSTRSSATHPDSPAITVAEAKAALFQGDADRQRRSRQTPAPVIVTPGRLAPPAQLPANPSQAPAVNEKDFLPGPTVSDSQGRLTSREMPLRSDLFDWSAEYFLQPQMKEKEGEEPGSEEYTERHWRRERNDQIILETQGQKELAGVSRWDQLDAELDNLATPEQIVFNQFETQVATADAEGTIRLFDWKQRRSLNRFSNVPAADDRFVANGSKVTTLRFINDDDVALLLTGTSK